MVNGFANESGRKKVWFDAIPFYWPENPCFYGNFPMDIVDVSLLPTKVYGKIYKKNFFDFIRYTGIQVYDARKSKRG